ncbi:MAG: acylphosphatase [Candidatus Micrarchaeota archaeon]|nr:acylphosphatase [Candidatus Micrarchaeota archaeon]
MRAIILVTGKVQGIGFRNFIRVTGKYGNLKGLVRNLHSGQVEIYAEGEESDINAMLEKIKHPTHPKAEVEKVEIFFEGALGCKDPWKDYKDKFTIDDKWGE